MNKSIKEFKRDKYNVLNYHKGEISLWIGYYDDKKVEVAIDIPTYEFDGDTDFCEDLNEQERLEIVVQYIKDNL